MLCGAHGVAKQISIDPFAFLVNLFGSCPEVTQNGLGYGQGQGPIGPNDILEFHVKVERILPAGQSAGPAGGGNRISEEDLQNLIAAMNEAQASGGR